jgi:ABC-type branched-subunit amino acid transport system substrate-binding protein
MDHTAVRDEPDNQSSGLPLFVGVSAVVGLIGRLCRRSRFGDRPWQFNPDTDAWQEVSSWRERAARQGLPIVCLVRGEEHEELLGVLAERLRQARPYRVPSAYVALDTAGEGTELDALTHQDVETVRDILRKLKNELARGVNARAGKFRFRLFGLADWLMDQDLGADAHEYERVLLRLLRGRDGTAAWGDAVDTATRDLAGAGGWLRLLALLRWVPLAVFRGRVTGQLPLLSGPYRWFLRQPHLTPEESIGFLGFAERLTAQEWRKENPGQLARFLTNAFLEDLRRAYRWAPWRWRRYRTTYVTVLLDNVTGVNGGYAVVQLINDVRNRVGRFDPLLVITASCTVPPDAGKRYPDRPDYDARHAFEGYRHWQNLLSADRRARRDIAWYLPLKIPGIPSPADRKGIAQEVGPIDHYAVPSPPWWSSRLFRLAVTLLVLAGVATTYGGYSHDHCAGWTRWPGLNPSLVWTGSECVGVTDGSYNIIQPSDASLNDVNQVILRQNDEAEQLHQQYPQRPYISLADVEALSVPSSSTNAANGLSAERESLEGVAVAQWRQLNKTGNSDPIIRVLIANAGNGMHQGPTVAQLLGDLAARDSSLVGVVGLDESRQPTVDTITALANVGLPMVAATLSADSLADNNPMYFQVSPNNSREAEVAAAFAKQRLINNPGIAASARVYYSDDATDTYSVNLRDDVLAAFTTRGFQTEAKAYLPSSTVITQSAHVQTRDQLIGNANAAGRDTCSYHGFVYFAGRGVPDFGDFLNGAAQCGSQAVFIGDDDVSRYVADAAAREQNRALPFFFESFALAPTTSLHGVAKDFYHDLYALFNFETSAAGRSFDDHAALSYDAALTFITAVEYLRESNENLPVTPGTAWREITAIHNSQPGHPQVNNAIAGVSGQIDFGGDIDRHVPLNKPVAILRVENGEVDDAPAGFCGQDIDYPSSPWCS